MKRTLLLLLILGLTIGAAGCKKGSDKTPSDAPQSAIDYASKGPGVVTDLAVEQEFHDFVGSNDIAVVKFGATWCVPCKQLAPEFELMAGYFADKNVSFAAADVDKFEALASSLGISGIPDVRIYYHGKPFNSVVGYAPAEIASAIDSMVSNVVEETPVAEETPAVDADEEILFDENLPPKAPVEPAAEEDDFPIDAEPGDVAVLVTPDDLASFLADHPVVVLKAGATWCPPCRKLAPKLPYFAGAFPTVAFAEIDTDDSEEISESLEINAIPAVFVFVNGEVKENVVGYQPQKIYDMIQKYSDADAAPAVEEAAPAVEDADPAVEELVPVLGPEAETVLPESL